MIPEFIALIIAIITAQFVAPAASEQPDPPPPAVVMLVGDSITDMHRPPLTEIVEACGVRIELHSLSGRRIATPYELDGRWINSGLDEIDSIRANQDPTTWVIELGSNDLPYIRSIRDAHERIDAVLTKLDADDRVIWTTVLFPHFAEATALFNEALTLKTGIELVEWHTVAADHLADAVHPTEEGARLLGRMYCDALDHGRQDASDLRSRHGRRYH
jgi:hypothetical protein